MVGPGSHRPRDSGRPNLPAGHRAGGDRHSLGTREQRLRGLLAVAGSLPGVARLLWLNHALYGGVVGSATAPHRVVRVGHINENLSNYARAIFQTQNVVPLLGLLAPFVFDGWQRSGAVLVAGFAGRCASRSTRCIALSRVVVSAFLIPALVDC